MIATLNSNEKGFPREGVALLGKEEVRFRREEVFSGV